MAMGVSSLHAALSVFPEVKDLPVQTNLPDVMTMDDGTRVTTLAQWRERREEMKAILEHYELGHPPPPPGNVRGKLIQSHDYLDGTVKYRLVHLSFGPHRKLGMDIAIFTPASGGPFPTIINPSFFMTPGVNFTNTPAARAAAAAVAHRPVHLFTTPVDPSQAALGFSNQLARGYAIVTYRYTQCGEDNPNFRTNSFYPAYPGYDWGELMGWAWGLSRVVDYVETQRFADKNKIIALGHSRLGKLTMVATAFDDRISLGAPAGSSGAGTGAYRFCGPGRGGKEGIEDMTRKFSYYFVPRLKEFTGQMYKLPFDAYWYVALTAPRPWISIEGTDDQNCVPNAVKQTVLAAKPVYAFLGVSTDRVGVNYEQHRHALTAADWDAALDFADQQLRGIDHHRDFDEFPPELYVFNVRDFGATGDGTNKDTAAFQKAFDACAAPGVGGEILVPPGNYLIGSVQMGSHTTLVFQKGTVITGSADMDDYPMTDVRWEGRWEPGHRGLIYATNAEDVAIIGPGLIAGNAKVAAPQNPRGAVVVEFASCRNVRWEDFSITQGGNWATHPVYCSDVIISNLTISGRRDGIDVDSCKHVLIADCNINTSDDSISLKSGRGAQAVVNGRPTEDVLISGCTLVDHRFASIGIGSETSGGIRDVRVVKCSFTARSCGIYIKTRIGRGGVIENISGDDLDVLGGGFLEVNLASAGNRNTVDDPVPGLAGYPQGKNFSFSNVRLKDATFLAEVSHIAPERPLDGFALSDITGTCSKGISLANIKNASLSHIDVTGFTGPLVTQTNVELR